MRNGLNPRENGRGAVLFSTQFPDKGNDLSNHNHPKAGWIDPDDSSHVIDASEAYKDFKEYGIWYGIGANQVVSYKNETGNLVAVYDRIPPQAIICTAEKGKALVSIHDESRYQMWINNLNHKHQGHSHTG